MTVEPRRNLPVPLRVAVVLPDARHLEEYAVNLSPGGVCLHSSEELPAEVDLRLDVPDGPQVHTRARVVWSQQRSEPHRFCETGLQFLALPVALREALVDWASQPIDRRR